MEFECVCLVGIGTEFLSGEHLTEEQLRIKKDLIYVGITRAMDELHIFGRARLAELMGRKD